MKPASHGHRHHHRHSRRRRHRATATPTPSPTATPTPAIDLNTEDTISPVTCNGAPKPYAAHPFLLPPYSGWTSIVSYLDHDSPNFYHDGLITVASGASAQLDPAHSRTDFPAYWSAQLRQYLYYDGHNGFDYNLSYVPIHAAAAGKVIFARLEYPQSPDHGYGNMVMIDHRNGYVTLYGHLSKIMVKRNQHVRAGQQIGISGNTGHSSGPHLHFTVFHNCTPTDPYGWAGQGPDPLSTYQGESSVYLWHRAPLVDNPLPGWPHLSMAPGTSGERILLLRLPVAVHDATQFSTVLRRDARSVEHALRAPAGTVRYDPLRGAVLLFAPVPPAEIYQQRNVVSITSPGTVEGARADVLAALARAALRAFRVHRVPIQSRNWSGYLVRWQGRAVIVGRGERGRSVELRLKTATGKGANRRVTADPHSGEYAVDLGPISARGFRQLERSLSATTRRPAAPVLAAIRTRTAPARPHAQQLVRWLLPAGALLLLVVLAAVGVQRGVLPRDFHRN